MSRYVSKEGVWFPAKEKVALVNRSGKPKKIGGKVIQPGEPYHRPIGKFYRYEYIGLCKKLTFSTSIPKKSPPDLSTN